MEHLPLREFFAALPPLAGFVWRLLSEQKVWTPERWFFLVANYAAFSYLWLSMTQPCYLRFKELVLRGLQSMNLG